jgi:hypothetical protein
MIGEAGIAAYQAYRQEVLQLTPGDKLIYECAPTSNFAFPEQYRCYGRKQVTLNTPP